MSARLRVAVLFGGLSSEHDVSVLTGLEALEALNPAKYDAFPVYVALDGQWWVGDALRERRNYIPDLTLKRQLTRVSLNIGDSRDGGGWVLREVGAGVFKKARSFGFDVVLPALHGSWGEDGTLQGVIAAEGIPLAGGNVGAMSLTINKMWTLGAAKAADLPVPPTMIVWRDEDVEAKLLQWQGTFPVFVKPNYLGSSIGARVAKDKDDLRQALTEIFQLDVAALVQRCIPNLIEYNVSVRRNTKGEIVTSAIERPIRKGDSYSFQEKYLSQGVESKLRGGGSTPGLINATRVMNPPELDAKRETLIREGAKRLFSQLDLAGAPRLDFLCDEKTGELWFNEINPIPGSFAFFLWEAAAEPIGFMDLLDGLLGEARARMRSRARVVDPVATGGGIFRTRGV